MFKFTSRGDYNKTTSFLEKMVRGDMFDNLDAAGRLGVDALSDATPVDTGETAASWYYEVDHKDGVWSITWFNYHVEDGVNIAIILQYGHATGTGGYVEGIDYINPAIEPIFDRVTEEVWKEVKNG